MDCLFAERQDPAQLKAEGRQVHVLRARQAALAKNRLVQMPPWKISQYDISAHSQEPQREGSMTIVATDDSPPDARPGP